MEDKTRERKIYQVTLVGSGCNGVLLLFKAVAGITGNSPAMVADAIHSLSDFITDILVLLFVRLSMKPQDHDHPYGHGKYETLATMLIGMSLLAVGVFILIDAAQRICLLCNDGQLEQPRLIALTAAAASIVIKELLYWYTAYYGRKFNSAAVIANAWHHRSDALSSVATLIGIGGAIILGDKWVVLDPIAAIIVGVLIMKVSVKLLRHSMGVLLDESLPEDEREQVMRIANSHPEIDNPHNLRSRHIGNRHSIELHVCMDGTMTVDESHEVTKRIEAQIREVLGADTIVNIHVEPKNHDADHI